MSHDHGSSNPSRSSVGRASRAAIGRTTSRISRLIGRSVTLKNTGRFLRQQLWAWPIIAAVLLGLAGWWVNRAVENSMREQRISELTTILDADVAALRAWIGDQSSTADLMARDEKIVAITQDLLKIDNGEPDLVRRLVLSPPQAAIRTRMSDRLKQYGFVGFVIAGPSGIVLAADQDPAISQVLVGERKQFVEHVVAGHSTVSKPYRSPLLLPNNKGELRADLPSMFAGAPIRDASGKPIAAFGLRIRPDDQFTKILQVAQFGKSGETYAFDKSGLLLSQSRFDDDLKQMGLLPDQPDSKSVLTLELRDPQVNMAMGERPAQRRADQPLTRMAKSAAAGESGCDPDGYRDYRGVPVVGAWTWLTDYDFGVATELDVAEAFQSEYILRRAFWVLMTMLMLAALGIFFAMLYMAKQQKALQKATLEAKQLGQYALEEKIGAGGMGTVYRARHAMLRRPTAVKLLDVDKVSDAAIARFEREVQLTGLLNHPNTIAIYDYGRTPDGIFYYAMEYLEGINLDELVSRTGPLPEARAVYILKQVCGSLAEAHAAGLVHRDIKPANIFLTRRGLMADFVKVLDFGLVKSLESADSANVTAANAVTGTPLYLSPEAMNSPDKVDAHSDVYAIGAVGYFLLTGTPVFGGATVMEICMKHVQTPPDPPSKRLGKPISPELEALILKCLAKPQNDRPADAAQLLGEFDKCKVAGHWTPDDAAAWWTANRLGTATTLRAAETVAYAVTPVALDPGSTIGYERPGETAE
jgi:hypothetical protein